MGTSFFLFGLNSSEMRCFFNSNNTLYSIEVNYIKHKLVAVKLLKYPYAFTSKASLKALPISIHAITKLIIASPGMIAKKGFPKIM